MINATIKSIPQTTARHWLWQAIAHQSSQSKWSLWWTCWSGCCTFTLTLSHLWSILSIRLLHFLNQNNHYDQQCRSGFCTFTLLTNSVDQAAALSLSQSKRSLWSIVLIRLLHATDAEGKLHIGVDAFILIWSQLDRWSILRIISIQMINQNNRSHVIHPN